VAKIIHKTDKKFLLFFFVGDNTNECINIIFLMRLVKTPTLAGKDNSQSS